MSYFDTIRCHSCRAQIDPDSIGGRDGFACPRCGETLNPKDLLGVSDAFIGEGEDEGNDVGLEDLMRSQGDDGPAPARPGARAAHAERQANPTGRPIGALEAMRDMKKRK